MVRVGGAIQGEEMRTMHSPFAAVRTLLLLLAVALAVMPRAAVGQMDARARCNNSTIPADESIAGCNEAIRANPKDAALWYNRGISWANKRDYDRALADYTEAIRLNPNYVNAYNNRGNVWRNKNEYDRAIADYTEAIKRDPRDAVTYNNRGNAWDDKGEYDLAIADYNEAIRLDPKYVSAYNNRGATWRNKRDYERAIADFNAAIRLDPNSAKAYNNRGNAWDDKGNYDRAIADYSEAIRLEPKNVGAMCNRGMSWINKGDYDRAVSDLTEAIRLDPRYARAYNNRGVAWKNKGDYDRAIADYTEAIRLNPRYTHAYNNRGNAWDKKSDRDRAIADYTEAISVDPKYGPAYFNRGLMFERKNELQRALSDFQRFAELVPSDPDGPKAAARVTAALRQQAGQPRVQPAPPVAAGPPTAAPADRRVALVIGNSNYQYAATLNNPANDARALAEALRNAGFQSVTEKSDLSREQTIAALREFANVADTADWAVVYYSGHGVEFGGINYLVPIDARLKFDRDIDLESVDVGKVLSAIEGARKLRLVILDACRDNPFLSQMRRTMAGRSLGRGLASMEPEAGTLIVYSAKHGEIALDGDSANSPFVIALIRRLPTPNLEIRRLFDLVRDDVMDATRKRQQPFSYGSLSGSEDYFFVTK